jgi:16S rRNA (uracil1498-N3)-methyltransferase
MNVVLLRPEQVDDAGTAIIVGAVAEHVRSILHKQVGDGLRVGCIGGRLGDARIVAVDGEGFTLECVFDREPPPKSGIELVLALPRPPVLRRVLQQACTMGIARIVLCNAARVEKSYWGSPALAPAAIEEQLVLGLAQAGDTVLPIVEQRTRVRPYVEDELAVHACATRFIADPSGELVCPSDVEGASVLAVGPEGGWVPYELELFVGAGFVAIGMGARILRVETAVVALLARLRG